MARKHKHPEHVNNERWLLSYADFITLLFAFFVVMFAVSQTPDSKKVGRFTESFIGTLEWEIIPGQGRGMMAGAGNSLSNRNKGPGQGQGGPKAGGTMTRDEKVQRNKAILKEAVLRAVGPQQSALQEMEVEDVNGELVIRLPEKLIFASGEAKLTPEGTKAIDALARQLKNHPSTMRIEGHSDSIPTHSEKFYSNWELSTGRATSVLERFYEVHRFKAEKLSAAGYSEFKPIAPNDSAEGRAKNRRVEIVLVSGSEVSLDDVPVEPEPPAGAAHATTPDVNGDHASDAGAAPGHDQAGAAPPGHDQTGHTPAPHDSHNETKGAPDHGKEHHP